MSERLTEPSVFPEDMSALHTVNDGLRTLLSAAVGITQADDLLCCRMVVEELRKGLQQRTLHTRYRQLAIDALETAEHWLLKAGIEGNNPWTISH